MGILNWLAGRDYDDNDDRPERKELNKETVRWNKELKEDKGASNDDAAKLMNKNYKAHIGKTAQEQRNDHNVPGNKTARKEWSREELKRETRLERAQREAWEDIPDAQGTIEAAEGVIDNADYWWLEEQ